MDDASRVRRRQRVADLCDDPHCFRDRQRPPPQALRQRFALVVGHRDERLSLELSDFVDRGDVRVVQGARGARLTQQAFSGLLARRGAGLKELQGDMPVQLRVLGQPDGAHPTGAEMTDDAVVGDGTANHVRPFYDGAAARDLTTDVPDASGMHSVAAICHHLQPRGSELLRE